MPILVSTFCVVAGLALLAPLALIFGARLPALFRDDNDTGMIGFALLVYFVSLVTLVAGAIGWTKIRDLLRSRFKHVRRMIGQIEDRYRDLKKPVDEPATRLAQAETVAEVVPIATAVPVVRVPSARTSSGTTGAVLTPFRAQ